MELTKHVISNKFHSQTIYCPKSEVFLDDKNYTLLGFKDSIPVLAGKMHDNKFSCVKKTLKVEVDSATGDKYITLNGKKIKVIPESQLTKSTNQVGKIASLDSIATGKLTILKGIPLKTSKFRFAPYPNKGDNTINRIDKQIIPPDEISKINDTSQKTLIKENQLLNVKTLSSKVKVEANVADNIATDNCLDMSKSSSNTSLVNTPEDDTKCDVVNVRALDLTNYTMKRRNSVKSIDNCTQTDRKIVDVAVQTDDYDFFNDFTNFEDIIRVLEQPLSPPIPSKNLNCTDVQDQKNLNVSVESDSANSFYTELRMALQPDDKGNMPIHVGVLMNNLKMVKRSWFILNILQQSLDLPNNSDYTALQLAIINEASNDIITFLLSKQANLGVIDNEGNNVIHLAVEYGRVDALPILMGYAEKTHFSLDSYNHEGLTPLMICCLNGQHSGARFLLDYCAEINVRDQISGRTALFHAAECLDMEMVQLLLEHQADTKIKNFFGTSPHDAMYEIDDIPEQIKSLILGRNNKRKTTDEPKPTKTRRDDNNSPTRKVKTGLKTYARYQKLDQRDVVKKLPRIVK